MAGRPLTAPIRDRRDGGASVSFPEARGSTKRTTISFPNRTTAERWRADALAAWKAGHPVPDPGPYRAAAARRVTEALGDGFSEVAWAWWKKFYPEGDSDPERSAAVARDISAQLIPFFGPRADHIRDISFEDCEEFIDFMSGRRDDPSAVTMLLEAQDFTLAQAAVWCGRSKGALRRAWQVRKFPNAFVSGSDKGQGVIHVPVGDLISAGYRPIDKTHDVPFGFAESTVKGFLGILRQIFKYARAKGLMDKDPSEGLRPKAPFRGARMTRPAVEEPVFAFDLRSSKRIAQELHIHHQMTFWLLRGVGLRISEAYGITLEDVYRDQGRMMLRIWRQGGKNYRVLDEEGKIRVVTSKKKVKTSASYRVLPVAKAVANLIDVYIEAFHSDTGDQTTPLLISSRGGGQGGFRDALEKATVKSGLGAAVMGFKASPHSHRKFFATDLDDVTPRARSIYLGHQLQERDGGAAITESTYTLRKRSISRLLEIADAMDQLITASVGNLVCPSTITHLLPLGKQDRSENRSHVIDVLTAHGFVSAPPEGEDAIELSEAADILGMSQRQLGLLTQRGVLERKHIGAAGSVFRTGVSMASVLSLHDLNQRLWTRKQLYEEFDITYYELKLLIDQLGIKAVDDVVANGYRYLDSEVGKIRLHLATQNQKRAGALSVAEAGRAIGLHRRSIDRLIQSGRLELDETATKELGLVMIRQESVDGFKTVRARTAVEPSKAPPGTIPIGEAQARTGLNRQQFLSLRKRGVVIRRTRDYQFHVDEKSLAKYLESAK